MHESLIPEAAQMPVGSALKLNIWAGVAVLTAFVSRWWLQHYLEADSSIRALVALAPLAPSLLWARSINLWMRRLDELQRRIQCEAWLFGTMGTVLATTALNLLESSHIPIWGRLSNGLGWEGVFALMFFLYCVGAALATRRYQ